MHPLPKRAALGAALALAPILQLQGGGGALLGATLASGADPCGPIAPATNHTAVATAGAGAAGESAWVVTEPNCAKLGPDAICCPPTGPCTPPPPPPPSPPPPLPPPPPPPAEELSIAIDPSNVTDRVGPYMYGSGIETYENQMFGA